MNFRRHRRSRADNAVNLTPLIDVVFLLLIFFMVSTTFTKETHLAIELPEADGYATEPPPDAIEIVVSRDGRYAVNGVVLADDQPQLLRGALLEHAGERRDLPLAISADADATHQSVVHAMDVAGQLGFAHLRIVTRALGTE